MNDRVRESDVIDGIRWVEAAPVSCGHPDRTALEAERNIQSTRTDRAQILDHGVRNQPDVSGMNSILSPSWHALVCRC